MNEQKVSLWKYLHENDVRYLTDGGFAVNIHGYKRSTGDIDRLDIEELEKLNNH